MLRKLVDEGLNDMLDIRFSRCDHGRSENLPESEEGGKSEKRKESLPSSTVDLHIPFPLVLDCSHVTGMTQVSYSTQSYPILFYLVLWTSAHHQSTPESSLHAWP